MTKTKDELLALAAYLDEDAELLDKHGAIGDGNTYREVAALIRSMAEAGVEKCLELADEMTAAAAREGYMPGGFAKARAALETALRSLAVQPAGPTPAELFQEKPHVQGS